MKSIDFRIVLFSSIVIFTIMISGCLESTKETVTRYLGEVPGAPEILLLKSEYAPMDIVASVEGDDFTSVTWVLNQEEIGYKKMITRTITEPGAYVLEVRVENSEGTASTFVNFDVRDASDVPSVSLSANLEGNLFVVTPLITGGKPPYRIEWLLDLASCEECGAFDSLYFEDDLEPHTFTVIVHDANESTVTRSVSVNQPKSEEKE